MRKLALMFSVCALALSAPAFAEEAKPAPAKEAAKALDAVKAPVEEQAKTSRGSVTIAGKAVAYTATAGTLTLRDDDGKPTGVFVTIIAKANGTIHGEYGKWRCLTPDHIKRVAQTGPLAKKVREVSR